MDASVSECIFYLFRMNRGQVKDIIPQAVKNGNSLLLYKFSPFILLHFLLKKVRVYVVQFI